MDGSHCRGNARRAMAMAMAMAETLEEMQAEVQEQKYRDEEDGKIKGMNKKRC